MITLRDAQFAQMGRLHNDDDWVATILDYLRGRFPGQFPRSEDRLTERQIRTGMERSRAWGLREFEDVAAWVIVMFDVSARFDEVPGLRRVLEDESLGAPTACFARLADPGFEAAWDEADEMRSDIRAEVAAWFPRGRTDAGAGASGIQIGEFS